MSPVPRCYACGNVPARPQQCAACRTAVYCDAACQRHAWSHRDHAAWCAQYQRANRLAISGKRGRSPDPGDPSTRPARRVRTTARGADAPSSAPPPPRAAPAAVELASLDALPPEMLYAILESAPTRTLRTVASTSTAWRESVDRLLYTREIERPLLAFEATTGQPSRTLARLRQLLQTDSDLTTWTTRYTRALELVAAQYAATAIEVLFRFTADDPAITEDTLVNVRVGSRTAMWLVGGRSVGYGSGDAIEPLGEGRLAHLPYRTALAMSGWNATAPDQAYDPVRSSLARLRHLHDPDVLASLPTPAAAPAATAPSAALLGQLAYASRRQSPEPAYEAAIERELMTLIFVLIQQRGVANVSMTLENDSQRGFGDEAAWSRAGPLTARREIAARVAPFKDEEDVTLYVVGMEQRLENDFQFQITKYSTA